MCKVWMAGLALVLGLSLGLMNANADVKRAGTQIPEEAIEIKAELSETLSEISELVDEHDALVGAHNKVLDLLDDVNNGTATDHNLVDDLALGLCGSPIYGEDGALTAEEQVAVAEWLQSCYNTYCSLIEQSAVEIHDANASVWELESDLNLIILTQPPIPPTVIDPSTAIPPSQAPIGTAGMPSYPITPSQSPYVGPTPAYPTPGPDGRLW